MTQLYHYNLRVYRKPTSYSFERDEFKREVLDVLAQNDKYIVLNDSHFTKLEKRGGENYRLYPTLNKPHIYFKDVLNAEGIFYSLYSTAQKRTPTIEREIREAAQEKYGWLFSDELDLSILRKGHQAEAMLAARVTKAEHGA